MQKKLYLSILACAGLMSVASFSPVYAGNRAGAASFTLGGGYDYFSSKREMQNTGVPFVIFGYNFTDRWGVEGLLSFFNTHFKNSVGDFRQIQGTLLTVDGIYRFTPYKFFEPYVMAGVGAMGLNPSKNDAHNQGNINAGVGAEFFFDHSIAFRFEARDIYTMMGGKNDVILDGGITFLLDLC